MERPPVIYQIMNILNGHSYIGSSIAPNRRFKEHRFDLRHNKHHSDYLQNAWNKYGETNFRFQIIEVLPLEASNEALKNREQWFIDTLKPSYNMSPNAYRAERTEHSERKRIEKIARDYVITSPNGAEQAIRNLSAFCRKNGLERRNMHRVAKGEISNHKGWMCRYAEDEKQPYVDKVTVNWELTDAEGKEYKTDNLRQFCREHGLNQSNVLYVAQGKMAHSKGWKARYADGSTPEYQRKSEGEYLVVFPDSTTRTIRNLSQFCKGHALSYSGIMPMIAGKRTHYKGYQIKRIPEAWKAHSFRAWAD